LKKYLVAQICAISNQMLLLLLDMRTHPAITLMHQGIPIVLSPDDPIIYGKRTPLNDCYLQRT
jgi:adenosine deaminase